MIHVLQVGKYYPPHRGGMETHLADLCQELNGRVKLEVLVAHKEKTTRQDNVEGIEVTRLGTPWNVLANPVNPELAGRIRRSKADIVHLHWPNPLALLAYQASGSKAKLVITYHSDIVRQKLTGALFQPFLDKALRKATVIATSPNYAESSPVLRKFPAQCCVVPLGINPEKVNEVDSAKVREYRQRFGERMVLATGRHIYYKGFQHLVEAMKEVDGHLVIAGDGPMRPELEKMAGEMGIAEKVSFTGSVSDADLRALYAATSVFVLPSVARSEAFGLVQLEAMAAGKPVINTALDSGVPYVSVHGETGLTVEPGNAASLAAALQQLLASEWMRGRYGAAARQRVYQEFTVGQMGERTYQIYRQVMGLPSDRVAAVGSAA